ncbi:DNAJ heat shock N-terminal domain-containing protein [Striga asiatica]|uniref:DNAJ heat shock N-terminal domain-containing protein n=1 Tax=Striga asiatica TaxID=4170 RepID=A0A5A7QHT6_STRAF|nr:DNAJ heat shock N-terminal domain-containing protein [Striga asiatica]
MRERRGISMEGDDILLMEMSHQREMNMDDHITPEKKICDWCPVCKRKESELLYYVQPGISMHSTRTFSKSSKEGRSDTTYNEATTLASNEQGKKKSNPDAELVSDDMKEAEAMFFLLQDRES